MIGIILSGDATLFKLYGALPIYLIIGISGIIRGFMAPAYQSIFPQLIPRELYPNAATWEATRGKLPQFWGPH